MPSDTAKIEKLVNEVTAPVTDQSRLQELQAAVNDLILHNFDGLLQLLYRLDVDEQKLRALLRDMPGSDAAAIITNMIIERQLEKIKSRRQYSQRDDQLSDEERW